VPSSSDVQTSAASCRIGPIESISLKNLRNVTDDVIVHLAENYAETLINIDISGCMSVSNRSIAAITLNFDKVSTLLKIDVSFIRNFNEISITNMLLVCKSIKELHIWGCTQISDRFYRRFISQGVKMYGRKHLKDTLNSFKSN
jgi:uncharacterized protein YlxP (DUF503 family)